MLLTFNPFALFIERFFKVRLAKKLPEIFWDVVPLNSIDPSVAFNKPLLKMEPAIFKTPVPFITMDAPDAIVKFLTLPV